MDKRKFNGGNKNAGRKPKEEEEKAPLRRCGIDSDTTLISLPSFLIA